MFPFFFKSSVINCCLFKGPSEIQLFFAWRKKQWQCFMVRTTYHGFLNGFSRMLAAAQYFYWILFFLSLWFPYVILYDMKKWCLWNSNPSWTLLCIELLVFSKIPVIISESNYQCDFFLSLFSSHFCFRNLLFFFVISTTDLILSQFRSSNALQQTQSAVCHVWHTWVTAQIQTFVPVQEGRKTCWHKLPEPSFLDKNVSPLKLSNISVQNSTMMDCHWTKCS